MLYQLSYSRVERKCSARLPGINPPRAQGHPPNPTKKKRPGASKTRPRTARSLRGAVAPVSYGWVSS